MRGFWNRDEARLERRLVDARPEPRDDFLDDLVSRVEVTVPERPVRSRRRGGMPRFALAGIVTAAMVVMLAAFGGTGYAKSATTHAVEATSHSFSAVFSHGSSGHRGDQQGGKGEGGKGEHGHDGSHEASHHVYPQPGFWCATKGSMVRIKLILLQERYNRLIDRGFVVGPGPFATRSAAQQACPTAAGGHEGDDS